MPLVERLNSLLTEYIERAAGTDDGHQDQNGDAIHEDPADPDAIGNDRPRPSKAFVTGLVLRYLEAERPLSGYFLVCSLTEIQWVVLGQVLASPVASSTSSTSEETNAQASLSEIHAYQRNLEDDAAAANDAWANLVNGPANVEFNSEEGGNAVKDPELWSIQKTLRSTLDHAMETFEDLLVQLDEMDVEPSMETYAYETMAENLVCRHFYCAREVNDSSLSRNSPPCAPSL